MYSTRDLGGFPEPEALRQAMLNMAALDVVLCEEDWLRSNTYAPSWADSVALAKIDNGAGDELWVFFSDHGVLIKGFDHESAVSPHARDDHSTWPGIYEDVPPELLRLLDHGSVDKDDVTFCIWRANSDAGWRVGDIELPEGVDDGSGFLLGRILMNPDEYCDWAGDYFGTGLPDHVVHELYASGRMTESMIRELNPDRQVEEAARELRALGVYGS